MDVLTIARILFYFFVPRVKEGGSALRPVGFFLYFMNNIWQDAGIRTRDAAIAARCAIYELHKYSYNDEIHTSLKF